MGRNFRVYIFVFSAALVFGASASSYSLLQHPLTLYSSERLDQLREDEMRVAFIGDSSLKWAIDSELFGDLAAAEVSNLALTAEGHNFSATFNMLRHLAAKQTPPDVVVIMQGITSWDNSFEMGGFCTTLEGLSTDSVEQAELINASGCINYTYFNLRQVLSLARQIYAEKAAVSVPPKTFTAGTLTVEEAVEGFSGEIGSSKQREIDIINSFSANAPFKVIWVSGPLHQEVHENFAELLKRQSEMLRSASNIKVIGSSLSMPPEQMYNAVSHVDPDFKGDVTRWYFSELSDFLSEH